MRHRLYLAFEGIYPNTIPSMYERAALWRAIYRRLGIVGDRFCDPRVINYCIARGVCAPHDLIYILTSDETGRFSADAMYTAARLMANLKVVRMTREVVDEER